MPFKKIQTNIISGQTREPIERFCLQVKTELEAINIILQWFERAIAPLVPEPIRWQCKLILTEGFTNTVIHAHRGLPPSTSIDLEVSIFKHYLEIEIWDWGKPFDLQAKLKSFNRHQQNVLEIEKGRGLQFMKQLTDDLKYVRFSNGRNCLIASKKIESPFPS